MKPFLLLALLVATPVFAKPPSPDLLQAAPSSPAPSEFRAEFQTTAGRFVVAFHREWAPGGVDRVYQLLRLGFYDGATFFRVIPGFMVQFGINGNPAVSTAWREAMIADDPATGHSNQRGTVTFAMAGPNTRTTQLFVNYVDNGRLDAMGFTPIGEVISGIEAVDGIEGRYGEGGPMGTGPDQGRIQSEGDAYLGQFRKLDRIKRVRLLP